MNVPEATYEGLNRTHSRMFSYKTKGNKNLRKNSKHSKIRCAFLELVNMKVDIANMWGLEL